MVHAVTFLYSASLWVLPVVLAITLHEAAHGFVAHRLGDDTAYRLGRVTLNPLKHIDLVGTILMPAILLLLRAPFLFGYAKPVPVNFAALNHPRRDMVLDARINCKSLDLIWPAADSVDTNLRYCDLCFELHRAQIANRRVLERLRELCSC